MLNKFVPSHDMNAIKHSKPCVVEKFKELSTATSDLEREEMKNLPYLQVIGSLLYVMCMTRPDVAFHVTTLCKFMHDPSRDCYDAAKKYSKDTFLVIERLGTTFLPTLFELKRKVDIVAKKLKLNFVDIDILIMCVYLYNTLHKISVPP